ncbi:helicase HerA domain-containing protein [Streptococcus sp. E29BA]|uniref:ATP-binding protein n=1 Tax=Streptococcus sp. E29BA TaxID=3278716 RepID=UPI00359EB8B1
MGIKRIIQNTAGKAADAISHLSALSPEQLQQLQEKQDTYLAEKPELDSQDSKEQISRLLAKHATDIYHAYLSQLKELYLPLERRAEYDKDFRPSTNIRYINITKWVTDKTENSLEKLVNVYDVLSNEACNISLVFHRQKNQTKVYLAVTNTANANNNVDVDSYRRRLESAIKGNFPGSTWAKEIGRGQLPCFNEHTSYSVATASNIPTEKSQQFISQTIEKLLDGFVPETFEQEYVLVLLATPIRDLAERKLMLSQIYSDLAPYASWQTNFTLNESQALGSSATVGLNLGGSAGRQTGNNTANTVSEGLTDTEGKTESLTNTKGKSNSKGGSLGGSLRGPLGSALGVSLEGGINWSETSSTAKSLAKGVTKTVAKTASNAVTTGASNALNFGINFGANFARSSNVTATIGKNEGIIQTFTNHTVKHTLELLDKEAKRLEQSTALGMWEFAAYVLSEDPTMANNVAHSYLALTQGEESHLSQTVVNLWRGDVSEERAQAQEIVAYLKDLRHPIFALNPELIEEDETFLVYPPLVTATTALSGKELAYSLNFPKTSIAGLPVLSCAAFGRNINSYEDPIGESINLGRIFHMTHAEHLCVPLGLNSLASHTLITGSTGTGKSNTIYTILENSRRQGIKFLVIEPAKGEYKQVFGNDDDVFVYGTNPTISPLLQINPFAFPEGIHILEHLDRLIELFNVCWPMYAAMPAVLKNAVEQAYQDCGWNLLTSVNQYRIYPTFDDIIRNIKTIINSSEYDNESKGAYKGALLTRLTSLTTGLNGLIFTDKGLSDQALFDENVIVDLSRVGSTETKSLIMGILVLKLQEYRLTNTTDLNRPLQHLTVLEEAHHLLKKTSSEQIMESANLVGKSVEMLATSIAEMRTYGEGVIIADQAPDLLDRSVIRNTNTKIILRLPDFSDRQLVGKSANLTDDQIIELAKLPKGVAAVYQNDWLEPVLCQIDKTTLKEKIYNHTPQPVVLDDEKGKVLLLSYLSAEPDERAMINETDINILVSNLSIDGLTKRRILNWFLEQSLDGNMVEYAAIVGQLYPELISLIRQLDEKSTEAEQITVILRQTIDELLLDVVAEQTRRDVLQAAVTHYYLHELKDEQALQRWAHKGGF